MTTAISQHHYAQLCWPCNNLLTH